MKKIWIAAAILTASLLGAKTPESSSFGIKFKGFVKTDAFFDTRNSVSIREGHFLLYPQSRRLDADGRDIHARSQLNILSIQTRLTGIITGPDAFGAKTGGVIEGAFFGHSEPDINGFRLRLAFLRLDWEKTSLLVGQFWHPMFITEIFPDVISFNTGVPFQPFSRNPQIRFIYRAGDTELTLTAASQRDFTHTGPGGGSSVYLRNSGIPILDANFKYKTEKTILGAGINFKSLVPQTLTDADYKTGGRINSFSAVGFARFNLPGLTLKMEGVIGENLTDLVMLGGYGVTSVDPVTGAFDYTGIKTFSAWAELSGGKTFLYGLFAGYSRNLGASDPVFIYYSRGNTIDRIMRISPRMAWQKGNVRFAFELECTSAAYGTPNVKGVVENTDTVWNIRSLFSAYLFF